MSRSRRKTPVFGITTAVSEKKDKRRWNRIFRKVSKKLIRNDMDAPVKLAAVSDVWGGSKDGKHYRVQHSKADMRK
ncbi:hypothetical protein [Chitinophaga sp. YR573]|uniref:hypothetical protein n=1 Tax=Chitinophaga sp. YR573 TaxID=1881040 RepID=UPI000B7C8B2E|nr:hypothetical protein [Chitinophaga sp. YR573]